LLRRQLIGRQAFPLISRLVLSFLWLLYDSHQ
jgi:hypothetical protein